MSAPSATVRVDPSLQFLLRARYRDDAVMIPLEETSNLGQLLDLIGVPRTEIGTPLVNGAPADLDSPLRDGDQIDIPAPPRPQHLPFPRFVLDVHLGTLARRLRLLGVDVAYRNDADDDELVIQAAAEQRVLLTQDRGLLRRKALIAGAYVRGSRPDDQLADVLERFAPELRPWSRCPSCNGALEHKTKAEVEHLLPEGTRRTFDDFARCRSCEQVYWRGAHTGHLAAIVATATGRTS